MDSLELHRMARSAVLAPTLPARRLRQDSDVRCQRFSREWQPSSPPRGEKDVPLCRILLMVLEEYFSKRGRHGESFVKLLAFSYRAIRAERGTSQSQRASRKLHQTPHTSSARLHFRPISVIFRGLRGPSLRSG